MCVRVPQVTGPAQVDDGLDDLHDEGRYQAFFQSGGIAGGRAAEPPVGRLQL